MATESKCTIFILSTKFQKKRLEDMKNSMLKKGLEHTESLSSNVTHIVSEFKSLDEVKKQLAKSAESIPNSAFVVSTSWLIECLKASAIVDVKDSHILKKDIQTLTEPISASQKCSNVFPEWACERAAKLNHLNERLTSAIEILQEHAELRDGAQDYSRALAFRRASSVLKSLPFTVQNVDQLKGLKDIGDHVKNVIVDILDHGTSSEVDQISRSKWYKQMKVFTSVFGVGPSTAKSWIERDWESIEDVCRNGCPSGDWRVAWGLAFFKDLNFPVARHEAETFSQVVEMEAKKILPDVIVTLVGGFRRGKSHGHDVDILLSHPEEGAETGLLPRLLTALTKQGFILIGHKEKNSFRSDVLNQDFKLSTRGQLDHFEKWLGICKFPKTFSSQKEGSTSSKSSGNQTRVQSCEVSELSSTPGPAFPPISHSAIDTSFDESIHESYEPKYKKAKYADNTDLYTEPKELARASRDWWARRVDLIIAPYSQYFYALVGWTGSKHFNRDARLYAQKKLNLKLTSHGLFDMAKGESIAAKSEKEVFDHLQLPFFDPEDRNC